MNDNPLIQFVTILETQGEDAAYEWMVELPAEQMKRLDDSLTRLKNVGNHFATRMLSEMHESYRQRKHQGET